MMLLRRSLIAAAAVATTLSGAAWAQTDAPAGTEVYTPSVGQAGKDVVWVPTPQALVDRMLDMAKLTPQDILVDLGSGDGRTVITAAKRGATARGIEFNDELVKLSQQRAKEEGVADRATFDHGDIFESDFSNANVVTLFLLHSLNMRLRPILLDMAPGTRIVANSFDMGDWEPDETSEVPESEGCTSYCTALKWVVPAKVAGTWEMDGKPLQIKQSFQHFEGMVQDGAGAKPVADGRLDGANIQFSIGGEQYTGTVDGERMQGTVNGSRPWQATLREAAQMTTEKEKPEQATPQTADS